MEDTERLPSIVAGNQQFSGYSGLDPMEDTESVRGLGCSSSTPPSYSGLDPMEDTERAPDARTPHEAIIVTVGSIRWRILKVLSRSTNRVNGRQLQWARSDGGY